MVRHKTTTSSSLHLSLDHGSFHRGGGGAAGGGGGGPGWWIMPFLAGVGVSSIFWAQITWSSRAFSVDVQSFTFPQATFKIGGGGNDDHHHHHVHQSPTAVTNAMVNPYLIDCNMVATEKPLHVVNTTTHPSFRMSLHDLSVDRAVSGPIAKTGCWECTAITRLQAALQQAAIHGSNNNNSNNNNNNHPWFLDIGGNIGMWSLAMAAAGYESFVVEPFPHNYQRICESVQLNGMQQRVHIMNVGATDQVTDIKLAIGSLGNMGSVTVEKLNHDQNAAAAEAANNNNNNSTLVVKGIPIDSIASQYLPMHRPVGIKIDVEGAELDAVAGALDFFTQANIVFFHIELRTRLIKSPQGQIIMRKLVDILKAKGLEPFAHLAVADELFPLSTTDFRAWHHPTKPRMVNYFDVIFMKQDSAMK